MKNIATLLLLTILLTSCNGFSQKKSPSKEQKEEVAEISDKDKNGLDISSTLLAEIQSKTKKKILPLNREIWNYDRNGNEDNYVIDEGIYFDFVDEITAHDIFNKYSKQVSSNGNYLFLTEMDFDDSYNTYYDVVILKCSSQFDLVKLVGTNGMNYDVYNQDIIDKLTEWHNQVGFEIVVVDDNSPDGTANEVLKFNLY